MIEELNAFAHSANTHRDVQRIVKNWNVDVIVECTGTTDRWRMQVRAGQICNVDQLQPAEPPDTAGNIDDVVRLVGQRDVLQGLFRGTVNPVRAATHGNLEVYGKMADQTRLDAVALVLWGP